MLYIEQTHAEPFCESVAEWVIFEADLGNSDGLSHALFFRFGNCVSIGVQLDSLTATVLSERPSLSFKGTAKFLLQAPGAVYICNGRRRKVDRKVT